MGLSLDVSFSALSPNSRLGQGPPLAPADPGFPPSHLGRSRVGERMHFPPTWEGAPMGAWNCEPLREARALLPGKRCQLSIQTFTSPSLAQTWETPMCASWQKGTGHWSAAWPSPIGRALDGESKAGSDVASQCTWPSHVPSLGTRWGEFLLAWLPREYRTPLPP